ncbi:Stealth CR1 domain-containing protein [Thalassotalea crassostreae]|uniref:Stealth CR1 domain-containing protein n=1 Tax=Thalassotalea crassostreae TaxID=1763536 RepID=UPI000837E1F6|nr:Stealth CR1 domain-containing protein [Thalassotalea crassostreae]
MNLALVKKLCQRILPARLYTLLYRGYFKFRFKNASRNRVIVKNVIEIPNNNTDSVSFELTSFTSSNDVMNDINISFEVLFEDFKYFEVKNNRNSERSYCIFISKADFNNRITTLLSQGIRVSIKGKDLKGKNHDFYSLSINKKSPICLYKELLSSQGALIYGLDVCIKIFLLEINDKNHYESRINNFSFKSLTSEEFNNELLLSYLNKNDEYNFDVDVVFTWVDGDDPVWAEKKAHYANVADKKPRTAASNSRFKSRDELKYALRSVLMYAPWVRKIYIVTDNQVPIWFKENEKVEIIYHSNIFMDNSYLPVFNSHAIESNLHRIKGLSENFLYFNDDCLLRRPISKSDFFTPFGRSSKFFYSTGAFIPLQKSEELLPVDIAAINNQQLIETLTGYRPLRKFQHTPIALKKSAIEKLENEVPEIFISNSKSRFRAFGDYSILSALIHHWGYSKGFSEPSSIRYGYINLNEETAHRRLERLFLNDQRLSCICINDVDSEDDNESQFFGEIMDSIYCKKSFSEK